MLDRLQSAFARERQFISDASHELRTPLTVINANAQLLQRWGDRDPVVRADSIAAIAEESGRLADMVSGMLTLAKAESGDEIPKEPLVLERLVDDVVAHARERAHARGLELTAHHPAGAGTIVLGDAGLLRQLVGNLVDNALKFTAAGTVEVAVGQTDGRAVIEVADTGPGIEPEAAERLFDRFFRGDPSHARTVEGTGLGLAIVRSIARVHGGTVAARAAARGWLGVHGQLAGRAAGLHARPMTGSAAGRYDGSVDALRYSASRWFAAGLAALLLCAAAAPAAAATASFDVGDQAWVQISVRGKGNEVAVRTWDRPTVQIDSGEDMPTIERRSIVAGTPQYPVSALIPPFPWVQRAADQTTAQGVFPPEDFPLAGLRAGPHDLIKVSADEGARLVVTVPASSGLLRVQVGGGTTTVDGYRGGNLFVIQGAGRVQLNGVATTAFAQMNNGLLAATDSAFGRLRVRTITTHLVFEHCRAKQIEASTISGSIVYDGGTFDPGLARFESQSGNIALGTAGAAQLTGRSGDGRVFVLAERGSATDQRRDGDASLSVGSNGPLVNAISSHGNVYLYEGTLRSRRNLAPEWRGVHQLFTARRRATPPPPPRADGVRRRFELRPLRSIPLIPPHRA